MAGRKVGQGRGAVVAPDGKTYLEGATIPGDVKVGGHVFEDVPDDADTPHVTVASQIVGPDGAVDSDAVAELKGLKLEELRERADAMGVDSSGTKPQLVERLSQP